ncbi:hypothetical protein BJ138DRAFT_996390 [Hygrophoropsis aurantiaca]|uniref:Uncharacterized protein n=1 Tax=Hygrophoropsis aurantiaca TaxID=72124 RepID=A0ACB8AS89_9AGAM|nr:hypothetical protein BJ138DRAFT_996390 [Hygrophoropsis aurantiaca]
MEKIRELAQGTTNYSREFKIARNLLAEVGPCASDLSLRRALQTTPMPDDAGTDGSVTIQRSVQRFIEEWAFAIPNADITSKGFNVTPKFAQLLQILKSCKAYGEDFRGIIFVHHRELALSMVELLHSLVDELEFIHPFAISDDSLALFFKLDAYQKFSDGKYNLLIITKSLEDLDIPKALVAIRYNLFESQISVIYARAHTQGRSSHLIHLVEKGNDFHRRILSEYTGATQGDFWVETISRHGEHPPPPFPLKENATTYHLDEKDASQILLDPTTSGWIRPADALTIVYRLAGQLQSVLERPSSQPLLHTIEQQDQAFVCTVMLPPGLPVQQVVGPACLTPHYARRMACFQICIQIFECGALDSRLFLLPQSDDNSPHNTQDKPSQPGKTTGSRCYIHKKPDFWINSLSVTTRSLYPLLLTVKNPEGLSEPYASILFLTRQPLPRLPEFKLFLEGLPFSVQLRQGGRFDLEPDRLEQLHRYTLRLCRGVANKSFTCSVEKMPYFLAPLNPSYPGSPQCENIANFQAAIAWDTVILGGEKWAVPLKQDDSLSTADVEDVVVQDRWVEFTRRFFIIRLRDDLNPMSKPADSPRESGFANLVEYCKARRKGFEGLQDYKQPLIEVSKVASTSNYLNPVFKLMPESAKAGARYLIPELCAKFTVPGSTLRTALLLPSVTRRIDDFLVVKELNAKFFNHAISEELLLAAISAPSAGFECDYERLELLGDAFLKYLSSLYLFVTNPAQHEGALHTARQSIISNKVLFQCADQVRLPQYIQGKPFPHKMWQPPNFTVDRKAQGDDGQSEGTLQGSEIQNDGAENPVAAEDMGKPSKPAKTKKYRDDQVAQWLGDKARQTIADVVEAIIGAAYISGGSELALKATKALRVPVPLIEQWDDFRFKAQTLPSHAIITLRDSTIKAVETIIGHHFNHPHLLSQALTHASIQGYEGTCYERLEFIGDAILDFMVICHVFNRNDQLSPGAMTLLKGAMVSNSALAAVCVWSGLHEHLMFESHSLANNIRTYAEQLKLKQQEEYESASRESRSPGQFWLEIEPPKALSDLVESIIGALYVSDGFSLTGGEAVFNKILRPFYDLHITLKTLSHHPTKLLFELLQAHGCQQFEILKDKYTARRWTLTNPGNLVVVHDIILASAPDATKHSAGRRASILALDALEGDPDFMAHNCDCRMSIQNRKARKKAVDKMLADLVDENGSSP